LHQNAATLLLGLVDKFIDVEEIARMLEKQLKQNFWKND
jgi:hypothetical protein